MVLHWLPKPHHFPFMIHSLLTLYCLLLYSWLTSPFFTTVSCTAPPPNKLFASEFLSQESSKGIQSKTSLVNTHKLENCQIVTGTICACYYYYYYCCYYYLHFLQLVTSPLIVVLKCLLPCFAKG